MEQVRYKHNKETHNKNAAKEILPYIIKNHNVKSVLDVGCGIGTWLSIAKELGVTNILGIDGEWVDLELLEIENSEFKAHDLRSPLFLNSKFDLVISLEVAEHIEEEFSELYIESLVRHSDLILFSAAIKNQGGQNHINEQNPDYWCEKFKNVGFEFHDILRPIFWNNPNIEYWYKQNIFLVSRKGFLSSQYVSTENPLTLVHPELLYAYQDVENFYPVIQKIGLSQSDRKTIRKTNSKIRIMYIIVKRIILNFLKF